LAAWAPFFRRALAKEPAQRFQSAEEMAQALTAVARGGAAQAAPASAAAPVTAHGTVLSMQALGGPPAPSAPAAAPRGPEQSAVQQAVPGWTHQGASYASPPMGAPAPLAGSKPMGPTYVSAQKPSGTPTLTGSSPNIEVVQPPPLRGGAPYWVVGVVGVA